MAKTLTEKQTLFLHYLQTHNGDIRKAMDEAGYSKDTRPSEVIKSLKEEIIEVGELLLAGGIVSAVMGLNDAVTNPSELGTNNKITAAKEILDRAGLAKKEQKDINVRVDGIFILPAKQDVKMIEGNVNTTLPTNPSTVPIPSSLLTLPIQEIAIDSESKPS